jgi:hypothetical protein
VNDLDALIVRYELGEGRNEDFELSFVGQLRDRCRTYYEVMLKDKHGSIRKNVNEQFFQKKLNVPRIKKMNKYSYMGGMPLTAKEMLKMMDKDRDGSIDLEELVEAYFETVMAVRDINKSFNGIRRVAKSVDVIISCLLLCIVAILYGKVLHTPHTFISLLTRQRPSLQTTSRPTLPRYGRLLQVSLLLLAAPSPTSLRHAPSCSQSNPTTLATA